MKLIKRLSILQLCVSYLIVFKMLMPAWETFFESFVGIMSPVFASIVAVLAVYYMVRFVDNFLKNAFPKFWRHYCNGK